jgi:glycosyltransferase involved in cell wall biosynthesis
MKINLFGQRSILGGGVHFSFFADAFRRYTVFNETIEEWDVTNQASLTKAASQSSQDDINIWFFGPNTVLSFFKGKNIIWAIFESDLLPSYYIKGLLEADLIWTPSNWAKGVLVANGVPPEKINVVPEGVDHTLFHPYGRMPESRPFRFLVVGKYEIRKSYPEIFEAFKAEFGNDSRVELVMKSDYFRDGDIKAQQMIADLRSHAFENWRLNWGYVELDAIADMYRTADVFLSAPRGEAWGLPIIEAAASGLPIISTMYSGHAEFLQPIRSSVVDVAWTLGAVDCSEYKG